MDQTDILDEVNDLVRECPQCEATGVDYEKGHDPCQRCGGNGEIVEIGPLLPDLRKALERLRDEEGGE